MSEDFNIISNDFNGAHTPAQTIKVIGVGGGGNNAVNHMYEKGIKDVSFILINTDRQVLEKSGVPTKLVIGPGRGAGGQPERAREYAESNTEAIGQLFDDNTDMVFVTAGMGGGTGTGAGPVVARIAKERGILTVGIVTVPFVFEGRKKILKALDGAKEMSKNVDALLIINNQRLTEIYPDLDLLTAFSKADDTLMVAAQGITDIITLTGIVNRDFNDVDTTLRDGGTAIISTGIGKGENRVTDAIADALASPLLKNTDIRGSKKMLMALYISSNPENRFETWELDQFNEFVTDMNEDVDVMWGLYSVPDLTDEVKVTILASGFDVTVDEPRRPVTDTDKKRKEENATITQEYGNDIYKPTGKVLILNPDELDSDEIIEQAEESAHTRNRRIGQRVTQRTGQKSEAAAEKETPASPASPAAPGIMFNDIE